MIVVNDKTTKCFVGMTVTWESLISFTIVNNVQPEKTNIL